MSNLNITATQHFMLITQKQDITLIVFLRNVLKLLE